MEVLSSVRNFQTILAILFIVLLSSYMPAEGRGASKLRLPSASRLVNRALFPADFLFGAGSSALQIEGSAHEGGRGPGVWDNLVQLDHERIKDADKFPTMIEHYKRYKEDVQHLQNLGINSYRFSISWSRVLPDGTLSGGVNQEGVDFYNHLIDELLANGITPFVTILHFDYPLALQKFGGFLNSSIVNHYKDYSELVFKTYGDRVKHWTTINEPEITALFNYMHGFDNPNAEPCQTTKFCRDAYTIAHNFILAHAAAVQLYRQKFQAIQGGEIGLVLSVENYLPYSSNLEDVAAAERLMDFFVGWIVEPVVYGDYPKSMRELVGDRLPIFTEEEKNFVKGSTDFIGINYYRSHFARNEPNKTNINNLDNYDSLATMEVFNAEGKFLGYKDLSGSYVYPEGLYNVLLHFKHKYQDPNIYITENGIPAGNLTNPVKDQHRIQYIATHLLQIKAAMDCGVKVRGYFYWAAFDTFEFHMGYAERMGLYYVDFNDNLKRKTTATARWYRNFLRPKSTRT